MPKQIAKYRIDYDGCYTSIEKLKYDCHTVDNWEYFSTFSKAKAFAIEQMQDRISDFRLTVKSLRELKKDDVRSNRGLYE